MSRSLGDFLGKKVGLIAVPEIEVIELTPMDKFIVLGSDGIFDVMGCAEVVSFVVRCEDKQNAAVHLAKEARSRWQDLNLCKSTKLLGNLPGPKSGIDDITALVVYFDFIDNHGETLEGMNVHSARKKQPTTMDLAKHES